MTVAVALQNAASKLVLSGNDTPDLDAEVLLAHVLNVSRTWLHAHSNDQLSEEQLTHFARLIDRRENHEPVAYLTGSKEFYGREFAVTPDVLIPRPETEDLVDLVLQNTSEHMSLLDVGTGSGCVGITLKLERPTWNVTVSDISQKALHVAKNNANNLKAEVELVESDLMAWFIVRPRSFDCIVTNLPYVNKSWKTSPETAFEPSIALFADEEGLALINKLVMQSTSRLTPGGRLLLEADPEQHENIVAIAQNNGFKLQKIVGYALSFVFQP